MTISSNDSPRGAAAGGQRVAYVLLGLLFLVPGIPPVAALLSGIVFRNFLGHPFAQHNQKLVSWLLKIAVVGLGFGITVQQAIACSKDALGLIVGSLVLVLLLGIGLGKKLGMSPKITHLITCGTAICGGSAIAALAPVTGASTKQISIALAVVFLFNAVALLVFPFVGHALELTEPQFGMWTAIAIHDTSSVVGASMTYGPEALNVATTVKLSRVLWIIPMLLVSSQLFRQQGAKIKMPWFILAFVAAVAINSFMPFSATVTNGMTTASKSLLVMALFFVGSGLSWLDIRKAGWSPLLLGLTLWLVISVATVWVIHAAG